MDCSFVCITVLCFIAAYISLATEVSQTQFILHWLEWYKILRLSHEQDQNIHHIFGKRFCTCLDWKTPAICMENFHLWSKHGSSSRVGVVIYSKRFGQFLITLLRWAPILLTAAFRHLTYSHQHLLLVIFLSPSWFLVLPHSITYYSLRPHSFYFFTVGNAKRVTP